jgi:hypothetical protein
MSVHREGRRGGGGRWLTDAAIMFRVRGVKRSADEIGRELGSVRAGFEPMVDGLRVRVLTEDGELLRQLTLDPSRDYQPQGRS